MSDKNVCVCVCAFMPCVRVRASYVIFEGETVLFQQPIGPSPINHSYHSNCMYVCVNLCVFLNSEPTPATNHHQ